MGTKLNRKHPYQGVFLSLESILALALDIDPSPTYVVRDPVRAPVGTSYDHKPPKLG